MADWNQFVEKTKNLTLIGVGKAKDMGEIARLNLNNISEEEKIKQAYVEIGMLYVKLNESPALPYLDAFERLNRAKDAIRKNKEDAARIRGDGTVSEEEISQIVLPVPESEEEK